MNAQNNEVDIKSKTPINNKTRSRDIARRKTNFFLFSSITFFTGVLLIIATYAWFSASINVKVKFFDLTVSSDSGLFISLDGIDYSSSVEISIDSLIIDLEATYPNHTNQWSSGGFWPLSSNGIRDSNSDKFDMFVGSIRGYRGRVRDDKTFLNTVSVDESTPNTGNVYVAFDLFLKNVSGSPHPDNLYLDDGTFVDFEQDTDEEVVESMTDIINSMRFGFLKIGSVPSDTDINIIQNLKCNNNCQVVIYEPNSTSHSYKSISKAAEYYGVTLVDGLYSPTYAIIKEGRNLELASGHPGSGIPLDTEHFALQQTITNFDNPIFKIPHGVTKLRVYVWIEGQDIDSLETNSKGAAIDVAINFVKDLAGYE